MAHTYHHNAPRRVRHLLKRPDKYTGWVGEGCWAQHGKAWIKKIMHRAIRRAGKREADER